MNILAELQDRFRAALVDYRLLPAGACGAAAVALVGAEALVGVALFVPTLAAVAALAAAGLLGLYSGAIAVNLARGRRAIDCGCMGPAGRRELGWELVARNVALVAGAAMCALPSAPRALVWIDVFTIGAGVLVAALLYAAIDTGLANARRLRSLM